MKELVRERWPSSAQVSGECAAPVAQYRQRPSDHYRLLLAQARVLEQRYGK